MKRKTIYAPNHPLVNKSKTVRKARFILWEKLGGKNAACHWCKVELVWMVTEEQRKIENALCVDHLDRDSLNDKPENLVPSCRGCNANRHINGRRQSKECKQCEVSFLLKKRAAIFCSGKCYNKSTKGKKVGTKAIHGTRSRYNYGCRCDGCRKENSRSWLEWANS